MILFPLAKGTMIVHGVHQQKQFFILSPVDTWKQMHIYGKTLGDHNTCVAIKQVSENKYYKGKSFCFYMFQRT